MYTTFVFPGAWTEQDISPETGGDVNDETVVYSFGGPARGHGYRRIGSDGNGEQFSGIS